eukprot:1337975-Pyramimonas_sp.AAC.1
MHVCVPQAKTWVKIDVPKPTTVGFSATAAAKVRGQERRVDVATIRAELTDRLSMFRGKDSMIYKCSAETARGNALGDEDD